MRGPVVLALAVLLTVSAATSALGAVLDNLTAWGVDPTSNDWDPDALNAITGIQAWHVSDSWFGLDAQAAGAAWRHAGSGDKSPVGAPNPNWIKTGFKWDVATSPTGSPYTDLANNFNHAGQGTAPMASSLSGGEKYDIEGLYLDLRRIDTDANLVADTFFLDWAFVDGWDGSIESGYYADTNRDGVADGTPARDFYRHIPVVGLQLGGTLPTEEAGLGGRYDYALALSLDAGDQMAIDADNLVSGRFATSAGDHLERAGLFAVDGADNPDDGDPSTLEDIHPGDWVSSDDGPRWKGALGTSGDKFVTISRDYDDAALAATDEAGFEYLAAADGDSNWVWQGTLDLTGISVADDPFLYDWLRGSGDRFYAAHYTYWCSNDRLGSGAGFGIPEVPELGPWALTLLGLAPFAATALRRRRKS